MSHLLDTYKLPGIGPGRIKRLKAAGLTSLEDLVAAGVDTVAAIPHIPPDVARGAVEAAQAVVGAVDVAPKVEVAPKVAAAPAPTAAPTPEPAPMSADDGDEDGSSMGGPKRLLGQLDEVLQRHLPGWSRIRDRARRNRS